MLQMSLVSFKRSFDDSLVNSRFLSITFGNIFDGTFVVLHGIVFFCFAKSKWFPQDSLGFLKISFFDIFCDNFWDFREVIPNYWRWLKASILLKTFFLGARGISDRFFVIFHNSFIFFLEATRDSFHVLRMAPRLFKIVQHAFNS